MPTIIQLQNSSLAGRQNEEAHAQVTWPQNEFRLGLPIIQTTCRLPTLLPGIRCYSDASILPDTAKPNPRKAGLGIFILDPTHQCKFFIKAQVDHMTSVLMAEAAGLALVASITSLLHIPEAPFLTDSQVLVNFFNGSDFGSPPHWQIKPFTQRFLNAVLNRRVQVLKIARNSNATAHALATQAFRHTIDQCNQFSANCTNVNHGNSCPLQMAL